MSADPDPTLSPETLAGLFAGALSVGVRSPPPEPPDWIGVGDFPLVIESYVGRGGSGFVWKASRRDGHGAVALKLVPFRGDPLRLRERWENECAALARIDHPNLIPLVDHGLAPDGDSGWLAMEWIEGRALDVILSEQSCLPFSEALEFLSQIGGALTALHAAGLVHRDVKPGNILRDEVNSRWVLADLGIALDLEKAGDHRVTRTMERPATPGYSPPELDLPEHASAASGDQYSLAFTLWEMLAGQRPLGAFPRLHSLCKCPEGADVVLRKALATDPHHRFSDLDAFRQAFRQAASRPPRLFLFAALFMIVSIAAGGFWFNRPEPFPKRFHSGKIISEERADHFTLIDLTLEKSGHVRFHIRTISMHPFLGYAGKTRVEFRDARGATIHELSTQSYGVNGRLIFGASNDRHDTWSRKIPPEVAARVRSVHFRNIPNTWTLDERVHTNRREVDRDMSQIRAGAAKGIEALTNMLSPVLSPAKTKNEAPKPSE